MKTLTVLLALLCLTPALLAGEVVVPSNVSHDSFDRLLKKHVDERGLVDYAAWKESEADRKALDAYLAQFADKPRKTATGDARVAALVNLYNALTIHWILANYPTDSIQGLDKSFEAARHQVGGRKVSLNAIEHDTLRPLIGYKAHGVLVCAARSCPPLQRFAYTGAKLDSQIDTAYRAWLARGDLNEFLPDKKKIDVSSIFKWFKEDFEKAGGLSEVLPRYAPKEHRKFLASGDYKVSHKSYNWGLNDQAGKGRGYTRGSLYWDKIIDFITFWN